MPYKRKGTHTYELAPASAHSFAGSGGRAYLCSFIKLKGTVLDKIYLLPIDELEVGLNKGRFWYFTRSPQEHLVQFVVSQGLKETNDRMEAVLNFIEKNIQNPWSLTAWCTSFDGSGKTILDFTFSSRDEALFLKMFF